MIFQIPLILILIKKRVFLRIKKIYLNMMLLILIIKAHSKTYEKEVGRYELEGTLLREIQNFFNLQSKF